MKYIIFLLTCSFVLSAQQNQADIKFEDAFMKGYKHITTNKDSTYFYFEKALKIAEHLKNKEDILYVYDFLTYTDSYHYELGNYKKHLDNYDKVVKSITSIDSIPNINDYKIQTLILKGNYYYKLKDNSNSKYYFEELYKQLSTLNTNTLNKKELSWYLTALNYMGLINMRQGRLNQSEYYFNNAIEVCVANKEYIKDWEERLYNNKKLLSNVFEKRKEYDTAISLLNESINFFKKNYTNNYKNILITCYLEISENYLLQNKTQEAEKTLNEIDKLTQTSDYFAKEKLKLLGDIYSQKKEYKTAFVIYDSILKETKNYRKTNKHQDVAEIYLKLGNLERQRNKLDESLTYYQKALVASSKCFVSLEKNANPTPTDAFSKIQLLTILKKKLEIVNQQLSNTKEQYLFEIATNTSKNIIKALDALRPEFASKLDKDFLISETYPAFHLMIQTCYMSYESTKDINYLEDALFYMEKSKEILLLESVNNVEAITYGNVPQDILDKEQHFQAYIAKTQKEITTATVNDKTILSDSLFKLSSDYFDFIKTIGKNYPKYHQLKYDTKTTSIIELQKFIGPKETILSFHQTESELYIIIVTTKKNSFVKISFSKDIQEDITTLYELLSKPKVGEYNVTNKLSRKIYNHILHPCLQNDNNINLTIIADGLIAYIPFGALMDGPKKYDYVICRRNIRYTNSATILTRPLQQSNKKGNKLLAISPSFDSNPDFNSLPFNKQEVGLISEYFEGKILSDENATLQNFLDLKNKYSLLHFATHALVNDEEPDYSFLSFTAENNSNNLLYVKDLYNSNIDAQMVTLSACQTGVGKLQKGEGMLSLARGFQYSGVKSITTSLWKNDDQTTSELMGFYYKHLRNGYTKSKALQKAKLDYLRTTEEEELKHPYYWASFVILGDNTPISNKPITCWLILGASFSIVGAVIFGLKKLK